jgi:hypothetical protein
MQAAAASAASDVAAAPMAPPPPPPPPPVSAELLTVAAVTLGEAAVSAGVTFVAEPGPVPAPSAAAAPTGATAQAGAAPEADQSMAIGAIALATGTDAGTQVSVEPLDDGSAPLTAAGATRAGAVASGGGATGGPAAAAGDAPAGATPDPPDFIAAPAATRIVADLLSAASDPGAARGPPPAGSVLILAATGGTVSVGDAHLTFAPGALPSDAYVVMTPSSASVAGLPSASVPYDFHAYDALTGQEIHFFLAPPRLTLPVPAGIVAPVLLYLDPVAGPVHIPSTVDADAGTLTALLPHFSSFVLTAGVWTVTLDGDSARNVIVAVSGANLTVEIDRATWSQPLTAVTKLVITSTDDQGDTLTLDLSGGALSIPIVFDGGGGENVLVVSGATAGATWTWNGTGGTASGGGLNSLTFTKVETVVAGEAAGDVLNGPAGTTSWTVHGTGRGEVAGLTFAGFETLAGGAGDDTLGAPAKTTGTGAKAGTVLGVAYSGMEQVALVEVQALTLGGTSGNDTFVISDIPDAGGLHLRVTVNGTPIDLVRPTVKLVIEAGAGNDSIQIASVDAGFEGAIQVFGDGGTDTLTRSLGGALTWRLTSATGGYAPGLAWADVERLVAGPGVDTLEGPVAETNVWALTGAGAGTVAGTTFTGFDALVGGPWSDTLQGPATAMSWTITGEGSGTAGAMPFSDFEVLVGHAATADTLVGPAAGAIWTLSGFRAGDVAGLGFKGFDVLAGGAGADTVRGPAAGTTWVMTGMSAVTLLGMAFTGIDVLEAGAGSDTLQGPAAGATWTIDGNGAGSASGVAFLGFDTLDGAGTSDTLRAPGRTGTAAGTVAGTAYTGMEHYALHRPAVFTYRGTDAADSIVVRDIADSGDLEMEIVGPGGTVSFAAPTTKLLILAGAGADTIAVDSLDTKLPALEVLGGDGADTLAGPLADTTWALAATGTGTVAGHAFAGIEQLSGRAGADTLRGPVAALTWTVTGAGAGKVLDTAFSMFEQLAAGAAVDVLKGPDLDTSWTYTGVGSGTVAGLAFSGMDLLRGGSGTDTLRSTGSKAEFSINGTSMGFMPGLRFFDFEVLDGATPADTLNAPGWSTTSTGAGETVGLRYTGMETLAEVVDKPFTVNGTDGNDTIIVRAAGPRYTESVVNGTTHRFLTPTGELLIVGHHGSDTITVEGLDPGIKAALSIYGDEVVDLSGTVSTVEQFRSFVGDMLGDPYATDDVRIAGDLRLNGGWLSVVATTFAVDASRTISTPLGTINVWARDLGLTLEDLMPVSAGQRSASITIGAGATLSASHISLRAFSWDGVSLVGVLEHEEEVVNVAIKGLESVVAEMLLAYPFKVYVKEAHTRITIGTGAQILATADLDILASTSVASSGRAVSQLATFGYAQAVGTAKVEVAGGVLLQGGGVVDVLAEVTAKAGMTAKTARWLGEIPRTRASRPSPSASPTPKSNRSRRWPPPPGSRPVSPRTSAPSGRSKRRRAATPGTGTAAPPASRSRSRPRRRG